LLDEVIENLKSTEVVLLYIDLTEVSESELFDRINYSLPQEQNDLVEAVSKVNSNVIVVLSGEVPFDIPWFDKLKGIIHTYLSGQADASALVDIIFGKVNRVVNLQKHIL
jgi:beta-glucosidase